MRAARSRAYLPARDRFPMTGASPLGITEWPSPGIAWRRGDGFMGIVGPWVLAVAPQDSHVGIGGLTDMNTVGTVTTPPQLPHLPTVLFIVAASFGNGNTYQYSVELRKGRRRKPEPFGADRVAFGHLFPFRRQRFASLGATEKTL